MRIPLPQGWERSTKMDSESIRFAIRNPGLAADGFTPNAVVTVEEMTGRNQGFTSEELLTGSITNMKMAMSIKQVSDN
jgi:hypothetical protein